MLCGKAEPQSGEKSSQPWHHVIWGRVTTTFGASTTSGSTNSSSKDSQSKDSRSKDKSKGMFSSASSAMSRVLGNVQMLSGSSDKSSLSGKGEGNEKAKLDSMREQQAVQPEDLPSVGSANHTKGTCKPCLFIYEPLGCSAGLDCKFCHLPHSKKITIRKMSKGKRERFQKLASKMELSSPAATTEPVGVGPVAASKELPDAAARKQNAV